jgi:hypothetical protein
MVPIAEFPLATPLTLHVTAVFVVPDTVAANCNVVPSCTLAVCGRTITVTKVGAEILTVAEPEAVGSATLVARTVT